MWSVMRPACSFVGRPLLRGAALLGLALATVILAFSPGILCTLPDCFYHPARAIDHSISPHIGLRRRTVEYK
jgi:hypothetical protein